MLAAFVGLVRNRSKCNLRRLTELEFLEPLVEVGC
jgi:hypothetical protein